MRAPEVGLLNRTTLERGKFTPTSSTGFVLASSGFCHDHGMVTGRTGLAIDKDKAEKRARRKWRDRVRWLMPLSWGQADWGKAKQHSYDCHKKHGTWR